MGRRLPPLNGLRAFEAAARHLSFTKAAEELFVTQAAISHQVKGLEEHLGVALFRRVNRGLILTDHGQALLPVLRDSFDAISGATERLTARDRTGHLTVTTMPSFAAAWLVPRLGRFRAVHPDIDIRLAPDERLVDFMREDVDIGVRYGRGHWTNLVADRFMTEDVFPVCSPELVAGKHPLKCPDDLRHHTLLHDDIETDWRRWLVAAGVKGVDPSRGISFNSSSMVVQAAVAGQGVARARRAIASSDLAAGRLVRPFKLRLPVEAAYYIVYPPAYAQRNKVVAFREWLKAEGARENAEARD
ncbi:MAG: transcriptional regulator GcvA [Alphaproteobacteria bacterium]